jgi:hypothetical protein
MFKPFRAFAKWWRGPVAQPLQLYVNKSTGERERVNLTALVSNSAIRLEVHNDRKHLVLPSYTLPDDVVMNGLLYPHSEIEASYKGLEGKLAPLGHPTVNGVYVSANMGEAINAHHIGAWNRNVERRGNRIYLEKWVDIEYAANTEGGRRLLERVGFDIEKGVMGEPKGNVHTSTGIFLNADLGASGMTTNGTQYRGTAKSMVMDHDCILLDEVGAATPDQGVGLMVNNLRVEDAVPLTVNEVLSKQSYGNLQRMLSDAANKKWGGGDKYVWVEDFDATTAIVHREGRSEAIAYSIKDDAVQWAETSKEVEQKTEWVDSPLVNRFLQSLGFRLNSKPDTKPTAEVPSDMDRKELDEALAANAKTQGEALEKLFAPIAERLSKLETNQNALSESLTANARAAEADKRKVVAEKLGQGVADALTGNALDECHAKLVGSAAIVGGFQANTGAEGFQKTALPEA